jgi:hypothetical protein
MLIPSFHKSVPLLTAIMLGIVGVGCGSHKPPQVPGSAMDPLVVAFDDAMSKEQCGDGQQAVQAYLSLLEKSVDAGEIGVPSVLASLDALVWRSPIALDEIASRSALAYRVPNAFSLVKERLERLLRTKTKSPISKAFLAFSLAQLAAAEGQATQAMVARKASGLVPEMWGVGPLSWTSLVGMEHTTPLEAPGSALQASYATDLTFLPRVQPHKIQLENGLFPVRKLHYRLGLYAMASDMVVDKPTRVWFMLHSPGAAQLVVGGKEVVRRSFSSGGNWVLNAGYADIPAGRTRAVVRFARRQNNAEFQLFALDTNGEPVRWNLPAVGQKAEGVVTVAGHVPMTVPADRGQELQAAAEIALGDHRAAVSRLETRFSPQNSSPVQSLMYARALRGLDNLPDHFIIERARTAYDRALQSWPNSWEAQLGHSLLLARSKSRAEERMTVLEELRSLTAKHSAQPEVRSYQALVAKYAELLDVSRVNRKKIEKDLDQTLWGSELKVQLFPQIGKQALEQFCKPSLLDRSTIRCLQLAYQEQSAAWFSQELPRLRTMAGSSQAYLSSEVAMQLALGNYPSVIKLYDQLMPGERDINTLLGLMNSMPKETHQRLQRDFSSLAEASKGWSRWQTFSGALGIEKRLIAGQKIVEHDRNQPMATNAATLILFHEETYTIDAKGWVQQLTHDIRRVAGTSDVEQGQGSIEPFVVGSSERKILRKRIHKKNGKILEPDRPNGASQAHADLSQLEPGDYVEIILSDNIASDRAGQVVIDTPDILPPRTSVQHASVTVVVPEHINLHVWSHPTWKTSSQVANGNKTYHFEVNNAQPRRLESGLARMDDTVSVSFGTYTWPQVSKHIVEQIQSLKERDPKVERWVRSAAGGSKPGTFQLAKLTRASGKAIRVANGFLLSDQASSKMFGSQNETARSMLATREGSRTWLLYRSLKNLGYKVELVVAESTPFSAFEAYPARPGRFDHPLLIVHPCFDIKQELWLDPDVEGPPLPPGVLSQQLVGRWALRNDGTMLRVPRTSSQSSSDSVRIELNLDTQGNAKGTFQVHLRGKAAQILAESFETVVGSGRQLFLRNVVLGWLPWATVDEVRLHSAEGSWEVEVRAKVSMIGYAQKEGSGWVVPGMAAVHFVYPQAMSGNLSSMLTSQKTRQTALAIQQAIRYQVTRIHHWPASFRMQAPKDFQLTLPLLKARRGYKAQAETLEEQFSLELQTGTVPVEEYTNFANEVKKLDEQFLRSLPLRAGK